MMSRLQNTEHHNDTKNTLERVTMIKLNWAMGLCVFAALLSVHSSADEFDSQIEARQAWMQVLGYNVGVLGAMTRGKMDYDADLATAAATNISLAAQMNNGSMWPQGSDMDSHSGTVAKAALWQNFADAGAYLGDLSTASAALVGESGKGLDELKAAFGPVGKTCSGCHKEFRAKK
jgi:cytochrome c556